MTISSTDIRQPLFRLAGATRADLRGVIAITLNAAIRGSQPRS
jgi:hypothetical protein